MTPDGFRPIRNDVGDQRMRELAEEVSKIILSNGGDISCTTIKDSWDDLPRNCEARIRLEHPDHPEPGCVCGSTIYINPRHNEMLERRNARFIIGHECGHIHETRRRPPCWLKEKRGPVKELFVDRLVVLGWGIEPPEEPRKEIPEACHAMYRRFLAEEDEEAAGELADRIANAMLGLGTCS